MKILVLKLGMHYNPNPELKNAALGEVDSIVSLFTKNSNFVQNYDDIQIVTDQKYDDKKCIFVDDVKLDKYDLTIVINGLITNNMDDFNNKQYDIIEHMYCPVIFMYCDIELPLKKLSLTRDDITCLTQAIYIDKLKTDFDANSDLYSFKKIKYFPFQKFPLMNIDKMPDIVKYPEVDLMYGGEFREGRRVEKMINYYFNHFKNYDVVMFGNLNEQYFREYACRISPKFKAPVDYDKFIETMSSAYSTIYISDESYINYGSISKQIVECIIAGCIPFIDYFSDPYGLIFKDSVLLRNLLYIRSKLDWSWHISKFSDTEYRELLIKELRKYILNNIMELEDFKFLYLLEFEDAVKEILKYT